MTPATEILTLLDASNARANADPLGLEHEVQTYPMKESDSNVTWLEVVDADVARSLDRQYRTDLPRANEAIRVLVEGLGEVVRKFEHYVEIHRAKPDLVKAAKNQLMADKLNCCLTRALAILKNERSPTVGV